VEFLEAEFGKCDLVEQIWLYGSSFEATLVAVVVPVKDTLMAWAASQPELQGKSFGEVCSSAQGKEHVLAAVTATGGARCSEAIHCNLSVRKYRLCGWYMRR
jgi:long-chain acyl-CoA synthetase